MTENKEKREKMADRVKKLIALSESPNPEEAALAMSMAKNILDKYGMTLTDVEVMTSEMTEDYVQCRYEGMYTHADYVKPPTWVWDLVSIVKRNFFTECINWRRGKISFLGAKKDVEISTYIFQYLFRVCIELSDEYVKKNCFGKGMKRMEIKSARHYHSKGVLRTVSEKLDNERNSKEVVKTADGTELMVIKNQAANNFMTQMYPKLGKMKLSNNFNSDSRAYGEGREAGKNVNLNTGVNGGGKQLKIGN